MDTGLESADRCANGDRVGLEPVMQHPAQEFQRMLPLQTGLASADGCANGDRPGATLSCRISLRSSNAFFNCMSFSQALTAALKVIVVGATALWLISHKSLNACFHCMPFKQALIATLKAIGPARTCHATSSARVPTRAAIANRSRTRDGCAKGDRPGATLSCRIFLGAATRSSIACLSRRR